MNKVSWQDARSIVTIENSRIYIDESRLDIFSLYDQPIPEWTPSHDLVPFDLVKRLYLDIETTGLNPDVDRVILIGLIDGNKQIKIFAHEDETVMLVQFVEFLLTYNPLFFPGFNNIDFDINFIVKRCNHHGLLHPFKRANKPTTFRTAQIFHGKPAVFYSWWLNGDINVVDLYHQALAWDFSNRKLVGRKTLKNITLQMKLRSEKRLELSYKEMMECWNSRHKGGMRKLVEYLKFDLEDTWLLGERLLPDIYYQKTFLHDWKLQSIGTAGNGSKWNSILLNYYEALGYTPVTEETKRFVGGYTWARPGIFYNVTKIDFTSLYPHIMLLYGICSSKDYEKIQLQMLQYMKNDRVRLKRLSQELKKISDLLNAADANQRQESLKIFINSGYGVLGTGFIEFNDYVAAALVTAYGRALIKHVNQVVIDNGGIPIEIDTDGLMFSSMPGKETDIWQACQNAIPKGFNLELEWTAKAIFVPPVSEKKKPKKSREPIDLDTQEDVDKFIQGLKKNYIILHEDGRVKPNGKFVKRDRSTLDKQFPQKLFVKLVESKIDADIFLEETIADLIYGLVDPQDLVITRKARKNEKVVFELGLVDDEGMCSYYFDNKGTKVKEYDPDNCSEYYVKLVQDIYDEMIQYA